jgi:phosphate:Na+ symporter
VTGEHFFLDLLGSIALLIWATRLVKSGFLDAFGERLKALVRRATASNLAACGAGAAVASVLQSSTASALLVTSFLERGYVTLATTLAVLLGANIGTTLVVQALSFDVSVLIPILVIVGVTVLTIGSTARVQNAGRAAIGLGLMILSLKLVVGAVEPLRSSSVLVLVLQQLSNQVVVAVVIAAGLAWLVHSSIAVILLTMSLAGVGLIDLRLALALAVGANIGSGLAPLGLSLRTPMEVRRALAGNLATRVIGGILVLPFLTALPPLLEMAGASPARQVANFHTAFNILLALAFFPFVAQSAKLLRKALPDPPVRIGERPLRTLDEADFDQPSIALVAATREVMRLAELVELMLREAIETFKETNDSRLKQISGLDSKVDELQEGIKLYLTRMMRRPLDEDTRRRAFDLILFTTNLEHVGDILDKTLLELAAKKQRLAVNFSAEGWAEIEAMHREVVDQMRLAITVFMTQDVAMARRLVEAKDHIRQLEKAAAESHLMRLKAGTVASIETSSLHLDVIRDLKRIVAHLTAVAHPILEAGGELSTSRLRIKDAS